MRFLVLPFLLSAIGTFLVLRLFGDHRLWRNHSSLNDPQALHAHPVPRLGSVGIAVALAIGVAYIHVNGPRPAGPHGWLLATALAAAAIGLGEDLTGSVSVRLRLVWVGVAALLGATIEGVRIVHTDIPALDALVTASWSVSVLVTAFVITGLTNAFNIIDGLNGLASACAMIILAAIGYVAFLEGDLWVAALAAVSLGAIGGFFIWNYPAGFIFLGDGGAYLCGFIVCTLGLLLISRHPDTVSPMFPLLLCIYPIAETVFSIYRRGLKRKPVSRPDRGHLHSLLFRRLDSRLSRRLSGSDHHRNAGTTPYLWGLCLGSVVPAVFFYGHFWALLGFLAVFVIAYLALYRSIVRFRAPTWL
ncbi:glycosyltransferase family 4 protein [Ideonella sp.]|uniref:glycosyltransferase family 4 protein n=1 Tax=Ideonella sp. TaxID=1929293 RepID=UPI0035B0346B